MIGTVIRKLTKDEGLWDYVTESLIGVGIVSLGAGVVVTIATLYINA